MALGQLQYDTPMHSHVVRRPQGAIGIIIVGVCHMGCQSYTSNSILQDSMNLVQMRFV